MSFLVPRAAAALLSLTLPAAAQEPSPLAPGWIAAYQVAGGPGPPRSIVRVEPRPAFTWGLSSPHPVLGTSRFRARWTGTLVLEEEDRVRWAARVAGRVALRVDGALALEGARGGGEGGDGDGDGSWVEGVPATLAEGEHEVALEYESPEDGPARLQLWWEGSSFRREPFPAWAASHRAAAEPPEVAALRAIDEGHALALDHGCLRCHALPDERDVAPGPGSRLERLGSRATREWLLRWLDDPRSLHPQARMPRLFEPGGRGLAERWIIAEHLLRSRRPAPPEEAPRPWREGKKRFVETGCVACHLLPDTEGPGDDPARRPLERLGLRMGIAEVAEVILDPLSRHPDGRMPRFDLSRDEALEVASFLLEGGAGGPLEGAPAAAPGPADVAAVVADLGLDASRVGAAGDVPEDLLAEAARRLLERRRCGACHEGLPEPAGPVPFGPPGAEDAARGCLAGRTLPRFALTSAERAALEAFLAAAREGWRDSPFQTGQLTLRRLGCIRCHPRAPGDASPLEGVVLRVHHEMFPARLPYLRVPSLAGAGSRFQPAYLLEAAERGVSGVRPHWYTYRMPAYGPHGREAVRALLEGDGELVDLPVEAPAEARPPGVPGAPGVPAAPGAPAAGEDAALAEEGRALAGHGGYACIACHAWKRSSDFHAEPGSAGPDLTAIARRVRREWFDRWLEEPRRFLPATPMPAFFPHGAARSQLGGDPEREKEALWRYLAGAPAGKPPRMRPPSPLPPPRPGERPRASQLPLRVPGSGAVEALVVQLPSRDVLVYDVERLALGSWWEEAALLRDDSGWRTWLLEGEPVAAPFGPAIPFGFGEPRPLEPPRNADALVARHRFLGFEVLEDGVRIRTRLAVGDARVEATEELRLEDSGPARTLLRRVRWSGLPPCAQVHVLAALPAGADPARWGRPAPGQERVAHDASGAASITTVALALGQAQAAVELRYGRDALAKPAAARRDEPAPAPSPISPEERREPPAARPGYRAVELRDPAAGLVMPCALAARPSDGKLFVASMKMGLVHRVDASGPGGEARLAEHAGPFQEPYGMVHRGDDLYVLHRRNITRLRDPDGDGRAEVVERVFTWPQGLVSSYDWAYGLVPEPDGSFLFGLAPWANRTQRGAGSALRLRPDGSVADVAFGFRNPVGWCLGPDGGLCITDNQGEWVAANRLCRVRPGRFYGFPNPEQLQHRDKPAGGTSVWVPYAWARSINGLALDATGGKFGPFSGQIFLAELYTGGAIIRAQIEDVNGETQGACFPFWGAGLLGPLVLAFGPEGCLYVGSITEPAWMGQPDRGALYRIDFTGETPFEVREMHARPRGFELVFTRPADPRSSGDPASYAIHHYRYSYGPEYGSPELERTTVRVLEARASPDGLRVDLDLGALVPGRVYRLRAAGARSAAGEPLVHDEAAYTVNEVPGG
ncbi:MAG: hypothetical protein HY721_29975 [Planctomycetes bacterium]|nr:hypothetical protein [Planctomycetota bacterium]